MIALATTALLTVGLTAGTGIPALAQPATDSGTGSGIAAPDVDWLGAMGAGGVEDGVGIGAPSGPAGAVPVAEVPAPTGGDTALGDTELETTAVASPDDVAAGPRNACVDTGSTDVPVDCVDPDGVPAPTPVDVSTLAIEFLDRCGTANDETVLPEAEGVSLTLLPVVDGITRVEVRAAEGFVLVDADGTELGATTTFEHAFTDLPCELTATPVPTVAGTGVVGQTLTATPGDWEPAPVTLSYQWYRGTSPIAGATGASYTLVAADAGTAVSVTVTGSKTGFTPGTQTSLATQVAMLTFTAAPAPKISGTLQAGKTLTATPGAWGPGRVKLAYQWYRGTSAIAGATASAYKLTTADAGAAVSVRVTGSKTGYTTVSKFSAAKRIATLPLKATPTPKIAGTGAVGKTLTAIAGTWSPSGVTLKYRWYRDGSPIPGATAKTYKLVAADAGRSITVKVTGSKTSYTSVSKRSTGKAVAKLLKTTTPKITGTGKVGKTLTAVRGTWGPGSVSIKYQWYRNGAAISGATKSTYTLTARDAGKSITVKVTGSKSGYTTVKKVSAPRSVATIKNPGDTKNCGDFATQPAAQKWFNHYYPLYGDIARLDRDNDRIACE